jgi:tetratricopeptide (TPR) repeat protein
LESRRQRLILDDLVARASRKLARGDLKGAYDDTRDVLRRSNKHGPAHLLMSRIAVCKGAYEDARHLCDIAVSLDGLKADYSAQLAFCQLKLGQRAAARDEAVRALALEDLSRESLDLLSVMFHALADYQRCADALRRLTQAVPANDTVLANLGIVLILCGDMIGARAALEEALRLNPRNIRAYGGLTEARAATPEDNAIKAIEAMIERIENPFSAIQLHHALAREYEHLGELERSFAVLRQAKTKLRSAIAYDGSVDAAMYRRINELIDTMPTGGQARRVDAAPIFVVGMPRSGTTVVERVLTNCEGVISIGESSHFAELVKRQSASRSPRIVDASEVENTWPRLDLIRLGVEYARYGAAAPNASRRVLDKMPLNFLLAPLIIRALPMARIIWLIRHPLDTVVGNYRQLFELESRSYDYALSLQTCALFTAESIRLGESLAARHPEQVRLVRYEELIHDPIAVGRALAEFCKLEWRDEHARIECNSSPVGSASAVQVRTPIHARFVGRWKHYAAHLDGAKAVLSRYGIPW